MSQASNIITSLVVLAIIGVIFFLGREVVCWYWKINERKELLVEIRDLLKKQDKRASRKLSKTTTCTQCHSVLTNVDGFCDVCGADVR